ncbi:signal peptidase II [Promicromonospora sp. NPDC050262]|uniref:signal peptidase II n=1 Tax=Promicromonospora sp. NPDC050262 TaxID=3155036 RepID=UPI0033F66253
MSTPAEPSAVAGDKSSPAATPSPSGSRVLVAWTGVLAALVLAADQLTKWWAESALTPNAEPIPLVGDLLGLRLIYNPGAALSIASGYTWILTIVVTVVVVFIVRAIGRLGSRGWAVALGLLLGGAVGNLIDRLAREPGFARGHVVDFIDYAGFFVGNVADIAVVAAAVLIALLSLRGIGLDGKRHTGDEPADAAAEEAADASVDKVADETSGKPSGKTVGEQGDPA